MRKLLKLIADSENKTTKPKIAKAIVDLAILMAALRYTLSKQLLIVSEVTDAKFQPKVFT